MSILLIGNTIANDQMLKQRLRLPSLKREPYNLVSAKTAHEGYDYFSSNQKDVSSIIIDLDLLRDAEDDAVIGEAAYEVHPYSTAIGLLKHFQTSMEDGIISKAPLIIHTTDTRENVLDIFPELEKQLEERKFALVARPTHS